MIQNQTVQNLLTAQNAEVAIADFLLNLGLATVLSLIVAAVYIRFASSMSNRRVFARNFLFIALTTTLVITVVKSSLALSLGLVGALSIVRFRTAIKDPEELAYLFLTIAIGLGCGAGQRLITIVAVLLIGGVLVASRFWLAHESRTNLWLTVVSANPEDADLSRIVQVLEKHTSALNLARFDATSDSLEATFQVEFPRYQALEESTAELQRLNSRMRLSFLDSATQI
jgi:uncharacterized membrane protein YhiD involved in acid resistance